MSLKDSTVHEHHIPYVVFVRNINRTLVSLTDGYRATFRRVHHMFHTQWPRCISKSSDDSCRDWSDVCFHCWYSLCNKLVCTVCHVSPQPLSPGQYRGPCCNPSGFFDLRHSACQCPAPTWKLVTLWQVGMDACDPGQIHTLFHPHLSSPTAPFVSNSLLHHSTPVRDPLLSRHDLITTGFGTWSNEHKNVYVHRYCSILIFALWH